MIMLDGMWLSVRRDIVEKEVALFVLGIDEEGYREILDFEVNPSEGAKNWLEKIRRLYERGVREVLLFVADRIGGLGKRLSIEIETWSEGVGFFDVDRIFEL